MWETQTFLAFLLEVRGLQLSFDNRTISKAAAYWGLKTGRIQEHKLRKSEKPGWYNGNLVSPPAYDVWLIKNLK